MLRISALYCLLLTTLACTGPTAPVLRQGNYYSPRYAHGFSIDTLQGVRYLNIYNPFQNSQGVSYRYRLDTIAPQRVVCLSTTHLAFLAEIGRLSSVKGVSGAEYVYNPQVQQAYQEGSLVDLGYDMAINIEKLLKINPQVIFSYGVTGEHPTLRKLLEGSGTQQVYIGEYTEDHPLGKAEWMVAFAAFYGLEQQYALHFDSIAQAYTQLRERVLQAGQAPKKVLLNAPWNDVWYLPGQRGYMATLLTDAGGQSVIPLKDTRDSYPISIEKAYLEGQQAEYWINPDRTTSLEQLVSLNKMSSSIPAFVQHRVYNGNGRRTASGGSDFYESGTTHPHWILQDLVHILHPELLPEHTLWYYYQLQ